jgi:hypothetical protein
MVVDLAPISKGANPRLPDRDDGAAPLNGFDPDIRIADVVEGDRPHALDRPSDSWCRHWTSRPIPTAPGARTSRSRRARAWRGKPSRWGSRYSGRPERLGRASSSHLARTIRCPPPLGRSPSAVRALAFASPAPPSVALQGYALPSAPILGKCTTQSPCRAGRLSWASHDFRCGLGHPGISQGLRLVTTHSRPHQGGARFS